MSHQFTMTVTNKTGLQLSNILAVHSCNQQSTPLYIETLANGAVYPQPVSCTTYSGHNDYYVAQFVMNGYVYQLNCYCNSDSESNAVSVVLLSDSYDISYNDTGCDNKSYSYTNA